MELANGQRPGGTVDWVDRREIGIRFDEPLDVLALINRKLVSQPVERRSMPRVEVRCAVHVKYARALRARDDAQHFGARAADRRRASCRAAGTYVSVFVEGLNIPPGEVVWSRGKLAGIEVFEELSWTSIIPWVRDVDAQERECDVEARRSARADEAVEHLLAAGVLEVDLELVAFDRGDGAVAELAVEDALAEREVVAALVAEADARDGAAPRSRAAAGGGSKERAARGALPAGAARIAAGDVGEGVGALGPLARHRLSPPVIVVSSLDVRLGQLGEEARGDRAGPLAVDAAVGGVEDGASAARAGDRDIGEAALLLEAGEAAFVERALRREDAFLPAGEDRRCRTRGPWRRGWS